MKNKWIWVVLAVVLMTATTANAHYWKNEFLHVNTLPPGANDFCKIFLGTVRVFSAHTSAPGWVFDGAVTYTILGVPFTFVYWSGPTILQPCEYAWFCLGISSSPRKWRAICGVWTLDGLPVGWTGPIWWQWPWRRWINNNWRVTFSVRNGWKEYIGTGPLNPPALDLPAVGNYIGCVTSSEVYYAVVPSLYDLTELNEGLWDGVGDPDWIQLPPTGLLCPQQEYQWDLGDRNLNDVILVRMVLADDVGLGLTATEVFQFQVGESIEIAEEVPTLSQWGLIVLGVLLVGTAAVLIVRRRRASLA